MVLGPLLAWGITMKPKNRILAWRFVDHIDLATAETTLDWWQWCYRNVFDMTSETARELDGQQIAAVAIRDAIIKDRQCKGKRP